jgi:hypothetical protein
MPPTDPFTENAALPPDSEYVPPRPAVPQPPLTVRVNESETIGLAAATAVG